MSGPRLLWIGAAASLLLLAPAPARADDPPPAAASEGASPVAAGVAFGLAGAGLVAGIVTGALSLSAIGDVKSSCNGALCPASDHDKATTAKQLGNASTASLIVAGAAALTGVALLVALPRERTPAAAAAAAPVTYRAGLGLGRIVFEARF